jgi:hypothetical protein
MFCLNLKLNQTVLELDFRAVKFLFFPRQDLNSQIYCMVVTVIRINDFGLRGVMPDPKGDLNLKKISDNAGMFSCVNV